MTSTDLTEYIPRLRLHLGDADPTSYRYVDVWLTVSLYAAVEYLMPRWNYKYLLTETTNLAYRNPNAPFILPEPPVIERGDIWPIVLQASIIIKEGSLENSSWNFSSWRDAEISYSNLESSRSKDASLMRDIEMLDTMLPWRAKRLAGPIKGHLPGYLRNEYEHD